MAVRPESRTIPYAWYANPATLRTEQEHVFARSWQYVAHTGQLPESGSFVATRAVHVPVLVVRARDGGLRGLVNVCRHRGSLVCEGEGRRETLQCPYHAWTYDLDGSLRSAPRADREPGFDREAHSLLPVAVDTWGPFVFVNPDPDAAPLAEALGELPALLDAGGVDVETLRFHHRTGADYAANWKVCAENYLECYHCQVAHPGFSKVVDVSEDAYRLEENGLVASQYGPVKGARGGGAGSFDPSGAVERGQFHFLFPNTTVNVMPGHPNVSIGPVVPTGAETTHRFLDYFFAAGTPADWIEDLLAFDDQVGAEDRVLVERVQRGVGSGALEGGVLVASERLIAHFQRLLVDALAS